MTDSQEYGISSRDYLMRARTRLDARSNPDLLYAAFELRCGVEARQAQYAEAWARTKKKIGNRWRIPVQAKLLEKMFKTGDQAARVTIRAEEDSGFELRFYFTPVVRPLRTIAGQTNDLLHAMHQFRTSDDPWWSDNRTMLEKFWTELEKANRGTLLGPPLRSAKSGQVSLIVEVPSGSPGQQAHEYLEEAKGQRIHIKVDYLAEFPASGQPEVLTKRNHPTTHH